MFFALYANRIYLQDDKTKQQYIEYVDKTKQATHNLLNSLKPPPPGPPPGCSQNSLRKRGLISGLASMIGDMGKLVSCAEALIDNLDNDVKLPDPPISLIDDLTNNLDEIGKLMEETQNENQSSSTSSSSTSSCSDGSAVPQCTITTTLSTSYYSGSTGGSTVETITSSSCTTITTCDASATTEMTTVSTSSSAPTTGITCSPGCQACQIGESPQRAKRSAPLDKRTLGNPYDKMVYENLLEYINIQSEFAYLLRT